VSIGATYEFDLSDMGTLPLGTRWSYTDDMVLTTPNDVGFYRDELTTLDAQAVGESNSGRYRFALWGKRAKLAKRLQWARRMFFWSMAKTSRPAAPFWRRAA